MGALIRFGGIALVGALGFRSITDGIKDVGDAAGDNASKIAPLVIALGGVAAFGAAAYLISKKV